MTGLMRKAVPRRLLHLYSRLTLLQRFAAVGVIVTMGLAIVFSKVLSDRMIEDALVEAAQEARLITTTLITPQVQTGDFGPQTPEVTAGWRARVGQVAGKFNVVRIKVWRPDGSIVYSDDERLIGRTFPLTDELQDALKGELAKEVSTLERAENAEERDYGKLLEVYVPVIPSGSGTVAGVYEVYQSFEPIQAKISKIRTTVWGGSLAVFSLLFASLFGVVRRASRQLALHALELEQRVAERTAALREAKADADRANQAKSEFLSRMSHELRTPLNAVLGFAQLLELEALNADQRENVQYILKGGRHLLGLINEVLDIARIEAGRLRVSLEPVLVGDVVRETLDLMRPVAAERHALLVEEIGGLAAGHVMADRQRLKQVLLNFVSNAIKYGGSDVRVTLSCRDLPDGQVRIGVSDTGPGIASDKLARLFTPFERLGSEHTSVEGTGLGLALSKGLTEAMGGVLGVESMVGRGSTFWVQLPAAATAVKTLESPVQIEPRAAGLKPAAPRRTVLYIEDNPPSFELIKQVLGQRPGVELLTSMQGSLGIELARRHRPDVILLDLHLPDIAGDEVLRRLREAPETRSIPVIMLSADATGGWGERLTQAGARAYVTKPLDVKPFLALLDQLLDGAKVPRTA